MTCIGTAGLKTLNAVVTGMSCTHCKKAVEETVSRVEGVRQASVELDKGLLTDAYDPEKVDFAKVQDAVVKAGYEAVES